MGSKACPNRVVRGKCKLARLLGLLCAGALVACAADAGAPDTNTDQAPDRASVDTVSTARGVSEISYHDNWRKLWEDHITWTRMVIIGILDALPGNDAYTGRLLQNYEDMEDALKPYYAADDVEAFGDLIKDHLTIAASILVALKAGCDVQGLIADWRDNAHALARQMYKMNPEFWPLASTDAMWQEHLDVTLAEATAHFSGDFSGEIAAWEKVHAGGLSMADLLSGGTMDLLPGRFRGCRIP
jgi:hypothetical protein